ncbi:MULTISPECIES: alpha/beta fold hydrolase [Actinomadura]|uniref:Alpha/beta fold hydrolase n=1 Tax=Actinomadura yumaensis TaxID=111807 RepID=A0ABW2CAS5_9ACTN|nr:alpha/beta hydrolase [Actinomadura sp. J1-007]MWK33427.1 alpha/beta fold hydrolase [Actinomadura sp. J1-007]
MDGTSGGICTETFGDGGDPPLLLVGLSMLTWPDGLCARLAAGRRFVVRYDLRDTGRSVTVDPDAPGYTLRDLVADAVGVLDAFGLPRAHVAGFGPGGWIAQLLALDHPDRVASLTLVGTRPTAPGPADADLPEHAPELMAFVTGAPKPDWSDRDDVVEYMVAHARVFGGTRGVDEAEVRERAGRIFDRAGGRFQRSNQLGTAFAAMDCGERWRERLPEVTAPTLVVHGDDDPFFPIGNGRALAREIPGAELLVLPETGQELPCRVWDVVVPAVLRHTSGG